MDSRLMIFAILNGSLNPPTGVGNQAEDEAVARKRRPTLAGELKLPERFSARLYQRIAPISDSVPRYER
jgi:hypothetical protein